MMKYEPDLNYINKRNALIPQAERMARQTVRERYPNRRETIPRLEVDREFIRFMTILAVEEGLINEGNLVIMNAKSLPHFV